MCLQDACSGRTSLHYAVEAENFILVNFLLESSCNVNSATFSGICTYYMLHTCSYTLEYVLTSPILSQPLSLEFQHTLGTNETPQVHKTQYSGKSTCISSSTTSFSCTSFFLITVLFLSSPARIPHNTILSCLLHCLL